MYTKHVYTKNMDTKKRVHKKHLGKCPGHKKLDDLQSGYDIKVLDNCRIYGVIMAVPLDWLWTETRQNISISK